MKRLSSPFIGFLQALGLTLYCSLVGIIMWQGNNWFGQMNNLLGPVLVLSLLVVSALICALIALGYPFLVFWDKKNTKGALMLIGYTIGWLVLFIALYMTLLLVF